MARRVESASAPKVASRAALEYLTIRFNIKTSPDIVKMFLRMSGVLFELVFEVERDFKDFRGKCGGVDAVHVS